MVRSKEVSSDNQALKAKVAELEEEVNKNRKRFDELVSELSGIKDKNQTLTTKLSCAHNNMNKAYAKVWVENSLRPEGTDSCIITENAMKYILSKNVAMDEIAEGMVQALVNRVLKAFISGSYSS